MFIDKQGKLFGKLNIIDLALIVMIITAGVFISMKMWGSKTTTSENMECTYIVKVSNIKETSLKYIEKGDTFLDGNGVYLGELIAEPEAKPAKLHLVKNDGTYQTAEVPGRIDVTLTIKGYGIQNENGFYLDGKVPLLLGTNRFFRDSDIDFTGAVVEIIR